MAVVSVASGGRIEVSGDLLFGDAVAACDAGRKLIAEASGSPVEISLAGLTRINSASAVVLVEWQRAATRAGKSLLIRDVPPRLAGMLRLSGLGDVLPLA
jgi:ABC-type transporter Mla MlaB component